MNTQMITGLTKWNHGSLLLPMLAFLLTFARQSPHNDMFDGALLNSVEFEQCSTDGFVDTTVIKEHQRSTAITVNAHSRIEWRRKSTDVGLVLQGSRDLRQ
ncbi:uncharacterized protein C8R40DRAFT_1093686 [Lentinula edodes]|uniref:uncharacterized protein n=1 Tax=Lentinula edodes TaxID=5353 RepID=UPI001E8D4F91|nr:uncharacterized protein C8R40DRAFT_1093686 [Lentinula edodes]KAH7878086.1 hypothetical protein C8R40DRAFT_1093686 [Lentinula edodes]